MTEVERYVTEKQETVRIIVDEEPESPREWDNLGTMLCVHARYALGDDHDESVQSIREIVRSCDVISLPLYLYDHSGITIQTTPFRCPWDSGQVGFLYVTKDTVRELWGWQRISAKRLADILLTLEAEVTAYDQYLRGDVYGYVVEDSEGEHVESCSGFFGLKYLREEIRTSFPEKEVVCHDTSADAPVVG